jgi:hypothetical protein
MMPNVSIQRYKVMKSLLPVRSDKPAVNFFSRIAAVAVLLLIASASAAVAQIYTFTFTGNSGIDATGTITISGGVAQSGSINVVNVPLESLPGTTTASGNLLTAGGNVINHDGDVVTYDTVANPLNDPVFDGTGVCFASGPYQDSVHYNTLINIWGNGPGSYGMFIGEANPADLNPDGTPIAGAPHNEIQWVYVYNETGTMTFTPVPEPATLGLISAGLLGLLALRRHRA